MRVLLTVAQAAPLMGLSRRQARRRLVELHAQDPGANLLLRAAQGSQVGWWRVDACALRRVLLGEQSAVADLRNRVGFLESDVRGLGHRIGHVEKIAIQQKSCQKASENGRPNGTDGSYDAADK